MWSCSYFILSHEFKKKPESRSGRGEFMMETADCRTMTTTITITITSLSLTTSRRTRCLPSLWIKLLHPLNLKLHLKPEEQVVTSPFEMPTCSFIHLRRMEIRIQRTVPYRTVLELETVDRASLC